MTTERGFRKKLQSGSCGVDLLVSEIKIKMKSRNTIGLEWTSTQPVRESGWSTPTTLKVRKQRRGILDFLDAQYRLSVYILVSPIHGVRVHYGAGKSQLQ